MGGDLSISSDSDNDGANDAVARTHGRIQHILNLNKGGRRIFLQGQNSVPSLPPAAWSHLLVRAGNIQYENSNNGDCCSCESLRQQEGESYDDSTASVVFSLLRQGPILFEH